MTKKTLFVAMALMASLFCATTSFAVDSTCSGFTGANVQFVAGGSSAQFNTLAFGAQAALTAAGNGVNFWGASSGLSMDDDRFSPVPVDSPKMWVAWDDQSDCAVYAYFSLDSTVGVKDFFAYVKKTFTFGTTNVVVSKSAIHLDSGSTFSTCTSNQVVNAGQPGCHRDDGASPIALPSTLQSFFINGNSPATKTSVPPPYCGQSGTTSSSLWCYWNAAGTDIRPEDALYATTRALSTYNTTNGLSGLGYNQAACGGDGLATSKKGCPIYTSFGTGTVFNALTFKITGTDPVSGAALPLYTTLSVGAAPIVVFVSDADTSSAGFGAASGDAYKYVWNDVLRKNLALFYEGTFHCTGDMLPNAALPTGSGSGSAVGSGNPVEVIQREPLSGTYNTFEFTGVRTLTGSAVAAVSRAKISSITWLSDDDSGQELGNNPALNFNNGTGCPGSGASAPDGSENCGDPLFMTTGTSASCGTGIKVRAIGTGELVKALSANGVTSPSFTLPNRLGYAFWGYGNFGPTGSGCSTGTGTISCTKYLAHYLTVDSIDPLFTTEGGIGDAAYPGGTINPNGAFHLPQCDLKQTPPSCFQIPFTHVLDGKYPLWSLLRLVTFANNSSKHSATPAGVLQTLAFNEKAAGDSTKNLDDYVPFLTNVNTTTLVGDLNLGVFRVHFKQTGGVTNPSNGHVGCKSGGTFSFTGVSIAGGTTGAATCLVDSGNDVGGSVLTVQEDVDFNLDFGSLFLGGNYEIYGLRQ